MVRIALAAAMMLGASAVALAQTSTTTPGSSATSPGTSSSSSTSTFNSNMNESEVKEYLQSKGYTNIQDLQQSGTSWTGKATENGQQINFQIDQSGKVQTQ